MSILVTAIPSGVLNSTPVLLGLDDVRADERNDEFIVASYSKAKPGFWVMNGWVRRVPVGARDEDLATTIESGLDASEEGIEAPARDSNPARPMLKLLGLRSYGAYMNGTRSVGVVRDGASCPGNGVKPPFAPSLRVGSIFTAFGNRGRAGALPERALGRRAGCL